MALMLIDFFILHDGTACYDQHISLRCVESVSPLDLGITVSPKVFYFCSDDDVCRSRFIATIFAARGRKRWFQLVQDLAIAIAIDASLTHFMATVMHLATLIFSAFNFILFIIKTTNFYTVSFRQFNSNFDKVRHFTLDRSLNIYPDGCDHICLRDLLQRIVIVATVKTVQSHRQGTDKQTSHNFLKWHIQTLLKELVVSLKLPWWVYNVIQIDR